MNTRFAACAVSVAALVAAADAALAQEAPAARPTVVEIRIEGNRRTTEDSVRLWLRTKVGQPLDRALLPEDINSLLQYFQSADVKEEAVPGGVRLVFTVVETEPVAELVVRGTDGLSETEVREVMETSSGKPIADFRLANDRRKVERLYRSKGWHFVQVAPRIEDLPDGKRVIFEVLEGPRVEIEKITFEGAAAFPKDKLLDHALMRETSLLGLAPGYFVEESVRQDLLSLRNFYRASGYLDAKVELADRVFSDDRRKATLTIRVTEGPAYTIGDITLDGVRNYPGGNEALLALIGVKPGDRKDEDEVLRSADAISRAYRDQGYFAVLVRPEDRLRAEGAVVDVVFRVEEQSRVRVRRLEPAGNVVTQDKVIRREMGIAPGDVLDPAVIEKGLKKLRGLGYFERVSARVEQPAEGEDPDERDVFIDVDDTATTGSVGFGVAVSSDTGLSAQIRLTKRNFDWKDWPDSFGDIFRGRAFTGAGQSFQLELAPGSEESRYRLAFTEPWLFDKPLSFGWDLFLTQTRLGNFEYDSAARGIDFFLGRRWTFEGRRRDTVFGIQGRTRIEAHEVDDVRRESSPTAFLSEGDNSLVSEELTLRLSSLDSEGNANEGWYAQVSGEMGFAGDVRLRRTALEAKRLFVLWRNDDERPHVLTLGARIASSSPLGASVTADPNLFDEEFVPVYESYYAGGGQSLRGFSYGGAGPHGEGNPFLARRPGESASRRLTRLGNVARSVLENDGDPMGGRVQFLTSAEYGFPIYTDLLRGVVFCDAGMVRHSFSSSHGLDEGAVSAIRSGLAGGTPAQQALARSLQFDDGDSFFSDARVAIGVGLRLRLPIFGPVPLALDFGFPIREQDGDDTQVVSFSIRRDF